MCILNHIPSETLPVANAYQFNYSIQSSQLYKKVLEPLFDKLRKWELRSWNLDYKNSIW